MSDTGSDDHRPPFPPHAPVSGPNDLRQGATGDENAVPPPSETGGRRPLQGENNPDVGTPFAGVPVQHPAEPDTVSGSKVAYRTPLARAAGRGLLDSVGAPYIEDGEVIVPKEGGHQNAYNDVEIVPITTESPTAQGFLKYLEAWSDLKAASTKEKVKPIIDLLKTKGEIIGRLAEPCSNCLEMLKEWKGPIVRFSGSRKVWIAGQGTCNLCADSRVGPRSQLKLSMAQFSALFPPLHSALAHLAEAGNHLHQPANRDFQHVDIAYAMVEKVALVGYYTFGAVDGAKIQGEDKRVPSRTFGEWSSYYLDDHITVGSWQFKPPRPGAKRTVSPLPAGTSSIPRAKKAKTRKGKAREDSPHTDDDGLVRWESPK
ncbi:hypothetical protein TREMEDRAFT_65750 [Tremella mesenterica DSM 1558]|uniref:uncharacterized protein n=1 Tax=Tremella mesenterica (strain ATCC 24925 / CBS 8224 / DSM 1558 / NBRC 9311 / NRRL Y-6157 / RJB 2259-6 / UBC 559-6) TaxID=578456 RepID=UPI00032D43ED|nr:uncharacterized protein TREMEDRAFT_65750 [Tremella mesenterica DSM 1558]EIW66153.1 hypothetical protein TREMEDRAFT_65750 [Tremella mesenterica DSM 1558]